MSVHASHNPFACEPVIINDGSSNGLVSTGEWTYIDNILTYQVGFSWRILPSLYANTQVWEEFIPLAAPGTKRDDIIVGNIFNTFERIQGQPGVDSWAAPTVPPGKVLIQTLTVTENGVEAGNPNLGSNFITKEVYSNYVSNIVGITNGFKLHETRRNLVIGEGNITEIEGFVEAENSGIYPNMYFSLENQSGGDIVLKHIGTLPIKMWFPKLEAYTLKNREKVWFTLLTPSSKRLIFSGSNMVSNSEGDPTSADQVSYDNTDSGLLAETVQEAVDEVHGKVEQEATDRQLAIETAGFAQRTGTEIHFDKWATYGTYDAPVSGNLSYSFANMVKGMIQVLYHQDMSAPAVLQAGVTVIQSGDYVVENVNKISVHCIDEDVIEVNIKAL